MATMPLPKIGRRALWFSPVVMVAAGYLTWLYWLKPRNATLVLVLGAVAAIFVMGYTSLIARRLRQRLDEVQIASHEFANSRGWTWGAMITVVLLMLPPVVDRLVDLANMLATGSRDGSSRVSVQLGLAFGFMLVVVMQGICVCVAGAFWWRRMGDTRERS